VRRTALVGKGRGTQELLTLYVVERWLARLSLSPHAEQLVLKGGMPLAAYDARRPTADVDALTRGLANDQEAVVARITEVLGHRRWCVEFLTNTVDDAAEPGSRIKRQEAPLERCGG
jgi:hypothetical protein